MNGGSRYWSTFLLVALFLMPLAFAQDFNVIIEPERQTIKLNETAVFDLTINHFSEDTEVFEIYSPDVAWDISTEPIGDRTMEVAPGQPRTTRLQIRPLYIQPGSYGVQLNIKMAGSSQLLQKNLQIGVAKDNIGQYSPAIRPSIDLPEKIYPTRDTVIKVRLENQNRKQLDKIDVKLRSQLINKDYTTSLKPLESKEVEFKVKLDNKTQPQTDTLRVAIFAHNNGAQTRFDIPPTRFTVLPYGEVSEDRSVDKGIFKSVTTISLYNGGNVPSEELIEFDTNLLAQWFTGASHDYAVISTGTGRYLTWRVSIDPMTSESIIVAVNWWPLVLFILFAIVAIVCYYMFRSPMVVKKGAMVVDSREGEISELKVFITLKNRSGNSVHDIVILDMVPPFAQVKHQFEVGTLNPDKVVRHEKKGTQLKWTLDALEPHEERILSYKIKTSISILGGFKLPPAQAKFKFFNYERISNSVVENLFNR